MVRSEGSPLLRRRYAMKWTIALVQAGLALSIWGGVALAAGPEPGNGPWVACPNDRVGDSVCADALGPDRDVDNQIFDCLTQNGSDGRALQNSNSGNVHCWAL